MTNVATRVRSAWNASARQIAHQPNVLAVVPRNARRPWRAWPEGALGGGVLRDAPFDFAQRGQVFVHAPLVVGTQAVHQLIGVFIDEIQNALVVAFAAEAGLLGLAGHRAGEQTIEDRPWIHFLRHRRRFGTPGQVGRVSTL